MQHNYVHLSVECLEVFVAYRFVLIKNNLTNVRLMILDLEIEKETYLFIIY
jgi:hypothetical protein